MILILCSPRTGSSLVTKIFHEHGCWIGNVRSKPNNHGYVHYENEDLRNVVKSIVNTNTIEHVWGYPIAVKKEYKKKLDNIIDAIQPKNPWCFKVLADYGPLFFHRKPRLIYIRRDQKQAIESMAEKGRKPDKDKIAKIHHQRIKLMKSYEYELGGRWVNTDELIDGNYESIREAIEFSGLTFNPDIVESVIDQSKWHHRR